MWESRWVRRLVPGVAALGAVALAASTTLGARDRPWEPPPCPAGMAAAVGRPTGAWYRLDPRLRDGRLVGQRLTVGGGGSRAPRFLDLPPESFAAGPVGGIVLVGSDDGERSSLALLDVRRGCTTPVATSRDVIRRATLTPDAQAVIEMRVDRGDRSDLGVFRRPVLGAGRPIRLLPPPRPDARFGPTWTTEFTWSPDGRRLAVQSCGERACRTRVLDGTGRLVGTIGDPELADIVGLTTEHLVVHAACGGLPCPLVAVRLADGASVVLADDAGQAVLLAEEDGRPVVVHEVGADGGDLRAIDPDGQKARAVAADRRGRRLVPGAGRAAGRVELPPGLVAFGPDGRVPVDGPLGLLLRRLADGAPVTIEEVTR